MGTEVYRLEFQGQKSITHKFELILLIFYKVRSLYIETELMGMIGGVSSTLNLFYKFV